MKIENLVIIGSGCAGYTAAIYAARADLNPIQLCGYQEGGQLMLTTDVENFPGFPEGIRGPELMEKLKAQAHKFGTRCKSVEAKRFKINKNKTYEIDTGDERITAKSVIITTGASARWLGLNSEDKYKGRGVHTCATCDGFFYKEKEILVVGGGDSACEEASFLSKHAKKVTIIHRRDELRASKIMQERVRNNSKINFMWDSAIEEIKGDDKKVTSVILKNLKTQNTTEKIIDGIFLAIGHIPNTKIFNGLIKLDKAGYIITNSKLETNLAGVYAAGDVQDHVYMQAITAAGTGCQAALEAEKYLEK